MLLTIQMLLKADNKYKQLAIKNYTKTRLKLLSAAV